MRWLAYLDPIERSTAQRSFAIAGRLIFIATHHKTGTVWMWTLFSLIAQNMQVPIHRLRDHEPINTVEMRRKSPVTLLFQDHGRYAEDLEPMPGDAGWHLVRDPRDVLISAANYHGWSNEPWLHRPRKNLGGQTYQAFIKPMSLQDAVRFEMDRSAGRALRDMVAFERFGGTIRDVAYEVLLGDINGQEMRPLFELLGMAGDTLEVCIEAYRQSHAKAGSPPQDSLRQHIQNLDGQQWRYLFDAKLLADFEKRYPCMAESLGYPSSDPQLLQADMPRKEAYIARYLANRGETDAAIERLRAALDLAPGAPDLLRALDLMVSA